MWVAKSFFATTKVGWTVGIKTEWFDTWGVIANTTDGGETWTPQICPTHNWLADVFFADDKTGWIVGTSGTILKTTNGGVVTNISRIQNQFPGKFYLHQNYPNPFNSTTIIQYSLPNATHVKICVFDMLGREIKTVVNEEKLGGNYRVEFNASDLSSGVYFYRIQTSLFNQTKKLILLR